MAFSAHWTRRNWRSNVERNEIDIGRGNGERVACSDLSVIVKGGSREKGVVANGCGVGSKRLLEIPRPVRIMPVSSRNVVIPGVCKRWAYKVDRTRTEVVSLVGEGIFNNAQVIRPLERSSNVLVWQACSWWSLCASVGYSARCIAVVVVVVVDNRMVSHRVRQPRVIERSAEMAF